jgi:hypothetical protein
MMYSFLFFTSTVICKSNNNTHDQGSLTLVSAEDEIGATEIGNGGEYEEFCVSSIPRGPPW